VVSHSPLETVARNHGAVMADRNGRRLPAHFGSAAAEETVCLRGVGMSDRFDRSTLEVSGAPSDVERALIALGELAWYSFVAADRAVARTEDAAACLAALAELPVRVHDRTELYAAIGLIGPRAHELLEAVDLNPTGTVVQEAEGCFEVLLPAAHGPQLWDYLLEVGAEYELACVGHDALDRLSASHRMGYWA
jgi:glycine cleavage system aminomethyltransferase T